MVCEALESSKEAIKMCKSSNFVIFIDYWGDWWQGLSCYDTCVGSCWRRLAPSGWRPAEHEPSLHRLTPGTPWHSVVQLAPTNRRVASGCRFGTSVDHTLLAGSLLVPLTLVTTLASTFCPSGVGPHRYWGRGPKCLQPAAISSPTIWLH